MAIPTLGTPDHESILSCMEAVNFAARYGVDVELLTIAKATTPFARNIAARTAMSKGFDRVFFVDDDTVVPQDSVMQLMAGVEGDPEIVSGVTPVFRSGKFFLNVGSDKEWAAPWPVGAFEIKRCGTSCLMIKTKVFDDIRFPWFDYNQEEDGTTTTEDIRFCMKARRAGYKLFCNSEVRCDHIKRNGLMSFMPDPPKREEKCTATP